MSSNLDNTLPRKKDPVHISFHCYNMGQDSSFGQNKRGEDTALPLEKDRQLQAVQIEKGARHFAENYSCIVIANIKIE